jgi:hypothetical protein
MKWHKKNHDKQYSFKSDQGDILFWIFLNTLAALVFPFTIFISVCFIISKIILKEENV